MLFLWMLVKCQVCARPQGWVVSKMQTLQLPWSCHEEGQTLTHESHQRTPHREWRQVLWKPGVQTKNANQTRSRESFPKMRWTPGTRSRNGWSAACGGGGCCEGAGGDCRAWQTPRDGALIPDASKPQQATEVKVKGHVFSITRV